MATAVGQLKELNRYPVKSLAGESLKACSVEPYGLHGDRFCAFYDEAKKGWASFVTARHVPEMLNYKASLIDQEVIITAPNGTTYRWNEELLEDMQQLAGRRLAMTSYKEPHPVNPELLSVDQASVLLVTDASLRKLEATWGKSLDRRRFRANLLIAVDAPHVETDWIGKQVIIGDAVLEVYADCERCTMITIDPETLERDPSLLMTVHQEMNQCFGVYASVKKPGTIQVGQNVYISD